MYFPDRIKIIVVFSSLFFFFSSVSVLSADQAELDYYRNLVVKSGFPENDETRRLFKDAVMASKYPAGETLFKTYTQLSDGRKVVFDVRKQVTNWYLIFRNERGIEPWEKYPVWGRGTWIIKKDLLSGKFVQAKIFLQDDENSFVRLYPASGGRSRINVYLYGAKIGRDVLIPVPFEKLLLSPFAEIVQATGNSIDWNLIFPDPDNYGYRMVENLVSTLRSYSDYITEVGDAAVNSAGLNVYINSGKPVMAGDPASDGSPLEEGQCALNCSGYVKWVADGIYSAWAGSPGKLYTAIPELLETTCRPAVNPWNEKYSSSDAADRKRLGSILRDPYFGLDWNRNIAVKIEGRRLGLNLDPMNCRDVRTVETGPFDGVEYGETTGYHLEDLDTVLYRLASERPGSIYLAAVNSRFKPDNGSTPLHQYWHVFILAPWFGDGKNNTQRGKFHVAVLDTGSVGETFLKDPEKTGEPLFKAFIRSRAARYADLGKNDQGEVQYPEIMVYLNRADIPADYKPVPPAPCY